MTRPQTTRGSSTHAPVVDGSNGTGGSYERQTTSRPVLDWDRAWANGRRGYEAPEHAELEARDMFQRVLSHWAMDVLKLKAAGLDRPTRPDRTLPALDALPLRPCAAPRRRAA